MKPLLLIGAALMVGAGIYGFVDYKKANLKKEFKSLYKEEPTADVKELNLAPPEVEPAPTDVPVYTVKKGKVVVEKPAATSIIVEKKKHKRLRVKEFSRAKLEEEEIRLPLPEIKLKP